MLNYITTELANISYWFFRKFKFMSLFTCNNFLERIAMTTHAKPLLTLFTVMHQPITFFSLILTELITKSTSPLIVKVVINCSNICKMLSS